MTPLTEEMIVYSLIASRFDVCKLKMNEVIKKFYKNHYPEKIIERSKMCHLISLVDEFLRDLESVVNG